MIWSQMFSERIRFSGHLIRMGRCGILSNCMNGQWHDQMKIRLEDVHVAEPKKVSIILTLWDPKLPSPFEPEAF